MMRPICDDDNCDSVYDDAALLMVLMTVMSMIKPLDMVTLMQTLLMVMLLLVLMPTRKQQKMMTMMMMRLMM